MKNLNPKAQLTIRLDKAKISSIAKEAEITSSQLTQLLNAVLNQTLDLLMEEVLAWILRFVPKRTGQLRDSLLRNMQSSRVRKGVLRFIIGTHLNYAPRVNAMSGNQVKHHSWFEHGKMIRRKKKKGKGKKFIKKRGKRAYAYYYGHYGRIFLDDPEAMGHFWNHLLIFIYKRAKINLAKAMQYQYGVTKLPWVIS